MTRTSLAALLLPLLASGCHVLAFGDIPCEHDVSCPNGLVCDAGKCIDDHEPDGDEGDAEGEGEGGEGEGGEGELECAVDGDCGAGRGCGRGRCFELCEEDADCSAAFGCTSGLCLPRCNDSGDCRADEVCVDFGGIFSSKTLCLIGCRGDASCSGGDVCTFDFTCEPPAGDGGEFAPCHSVSECDGDLECVQDFEGNHYCAHPCDSFADPPVGCAPGLTCDVTNACVEKCDGCTFDCCPVSGFTCDAETHDCVP